MGFFEKLKKGLEKTKKGMVERFEETFLAYAKVDEALFEELEEILITSDLGMNTTMKIMDQLRETVRKGGIEDSNKVREILADIMTKLVDKGENHALSGAAPLVILMIGVNGAGKTTSIAKIANQLKNEGRTVLLAAADTFRAAAIEQLEIWADRVGVPVIKHQEGADPAAVIFDAVQSAKARGIDVLICDTAGRLHNKKNLMNELEKMNKVIDREYPEADRETLIVLDAATGQNAMIQAKEFGDVAALTGIVLTKIDGTAKGGVVIGISDELSVPVKFIGVGEGMDDLQEFRPEEFVKALFERIERI